MSPAPSTLVDLMNRVRQPTAPLVTYYDLDTAERIELSAVTCANWVAKTANFLTEDLEAEIGTRVRIALPTHWLRFIWLASVWQVGAVVAAEDATIAVVGPDLDATDEEFRVASALLPFGVKFAEPPAGFLDYGVEIWSHPDAFFALDSPSSTDPAVDLPGLECTHEQLLELTPADDRRLLLTDGDLARDTRLLVAACLGGGSLVLTRGGDAEQRERIAVQEQATCWSLDV